MLVMRNNDLECDVYTKGIGLSWILKKGGKHCIAVSISLTTMVSIEGESIYPKTQGMNRIFHLYSFCSLVTWQKIENTEKTSANERLLWQ